MDKLIKKIKGEKKPFQGYNMVSVNNFNSYLIGVDINKNLVFMIKPKINGKSRQAHSSRGKFLDIFYDMDCQILSNGKMVLDNFTILTLKTENLFFETIFISICNNLIDLLGDNPDQIKVVDFVEGLRNLFRKMLTKPTKTEVGLWGELLLIECSKNKPLLIDSWHLKSTETFDFNDGVTKVEVKTTTLNERVHAISLNQLEKSKKSSSVILSIITSQIDLGISVIDLYNKINSKLSPNYKTKFLDKIIEVCGSEIENYNSKFDYNSAKEMMKFYSAINIPCIDRNHIPIEVQNVKFQVNLESTEYLNESEINSEIIKSIL